MSRSPSITEALAGAVLFGDLAPELAHKALLSGLPADRPCFPANVEGAAAAQRAGPGALLLSTPLIPRKVGAFWAPQPYAASEAIRLAEKHPKGAAHAFTWGAGVRGNLTVGALTCIAVEADSTSLQAQAGMLDKLEAEHGIRAGLVVMSGDTRADSLRPLGLREGAIVEPGKSLHVFLPIHATDTGSKAHRRALEALCVLMRADLAATDHARLMRAPGVVANAWGERTPRYVKAGEAVRVQTVLRAEANPVDVAELADRLEAACAAEGLDIARGLEALRCAAALRKAVGRCDAETQAALLQAAAETEAAARITPEAKELLRKVGGMPSGKRGAGGVSLGGGFSSATIDRDTKTRAVMPGGEVRELPLAQWGAVLAGLAPTLGEHGDKGAGGLPAWAPTDAGECHTSGDDVGKARETPAGRIWNTPEGVRLACFVESVVYTPSNPRDPATVCPPLPEDGASPYLSLKLEPGAACVLRSGTGTGKTRGVIDALEAIPGGVSTEVVTPRIAITKEAAELYGALDYQTQGGELRVGATPPGAKLSVAVCINSLARCTYTGHGPLWVVLEESEQIVAALFGGKIPLLVDHARATAGEIIETLRELASAALNSGGGVIAADAFAGDCTNALLRMILPPDTPIQEKGIARRRDLPVTFFGPQLDDNDKRCSSELDELLREVKKAVAEGLRVIVAAFKAKDALAWAEIIGAIVRKDGTAPRVKVYVSDTVAVLKQVERAPLDELSKVEHYWGPECADVVIYSPCVSAAVSYDPKDKAACFNVAALVAPHVTHGGWDLGVQMLDRARCVDEVWIACPARRAAVHVRPLAAFKAEQEREWLASARAMGISCDGFTDESLANLKATKDYVRQLRNADPCAELKRYFATRGATIVEKGGAGAELLKQERRDVKKRRGDTWAAMVCDAEPIDRRREAELLKQDLRHIPNGDEKDGILAQLDAFKLCDRYGREHLNPELVLIDEHGKVWKQTKALVRAALIADGETALAIGKGDAKAVKAGSKTGAKAEATKMLAALILLRLYMGEEWLAALLEPLRRGEAATGPGAMLKEPLPRDDGDGEALDHAWHVDTWNGEHLASAFAAQLKAHGIDPALLWRSGYGVGRVRTHHTTAIGKVLALLGMKTEGKKEATGDRRRVYRLDLDRWHERCELARKHNERLRGEAETPANAEPSAVHMAGFTLKETRLVDGFSLPFTPHAAAPSPVLSPLPMLSLFPPRSLPLEATP
jgi:hypothetical protein